MYSSNKNFEKFSKKKSWDEVPENRDKKRSKKSKSKELARKNMRKNKRDFD